MASQFLSLRYTAREGPQVNGSWHLVEDGVAKGNPIPDDDFIPDPQRPGRGWHKVTDYQYEQLGALLDGLETVLDPLPEGCVAQSLSGPDGGQPEPTPDWGTFTTGRRWDTYHRHITQRSLASYLRLM
jgi:hypothetical protein